VIRFRCAYRDCRFPLAFLNKLTKLLILFLGASTAGFASTPTLNRISFVKTSYNTTGTDTCRAFLNGSIGTHLYISLSSNNSAVQVPSQIMVSLNADSKGFNATIGAVKTAQTATITARLNGISKTFKITVSPAPAPTAAKLTVNATSIGFGTAFLNTPEEQQVTLSSTGTAAVTVNSATVSGTGFSLSGATLPATLNPGQSTVVNVRFNPTSTGSRTGQLAIASSASNIAIPLSGTGVSHQVNLSWNAPNDSSVVAFNIYRTASGSTSFQRVNGSVETDTAYSDTSVQSGGKYSYMVKSVDSSGKESGPSNSISVAVP
jgi:hypothetical protein